jgi:sulfatase maturation enzyme AslB (radical SAM superfamily)
MSEIQDVLFPKKTYDKANSILELRGIGKKRKQVLDAIIAQLKLIDMKNDPVLQKINVSLFDKDIIQKKPEELFYLRDHVVEEMSRLDESNYLRYLRYRYRYDVYPTLYKTDKFPPVVQIEPTSICNYRCVFCYQTDKRLSDKKNGHMGSMNFDVFKDIIDQLEGNVEGVTLASRGEPTVNRKLPDFLKYMSGKFLATKINTNAYLLDEKMAHAILSTDLQTLVFSADAASEPLYSKLRVNGDLERVVQNVERFYNIKEKYYPSSKLITRVSGVRFDTNQDMQEMESFWGDYVDQVAFVDYNPWENVYDSNKTEIDTPCSDLWRRMFVWWDGKIAMCDVDYLTKLSKETIENETISNIWNGETYTNLREKHISNKRCNIEPCSRCTVV